MLGWQKKKKKKLKDNTRIFNIVKKLGGESNDYQQG